MSTQNRRLSTSSSSKRPATENATKAVALPPQQPKKRPALTNLTNQSNARLNRVEYSGVKGNQVQSSTICKAKKGAKVSCNRPQGNSSGSSTVKPSAVISCKDASIPRIDGASASSIHVLAPCNTTKSPSRSDGASVSMDESMSTCESLKSPDIEYLDNADTSAISSLEQRTSNNLSISEDADAGTGNVWKRDILMEMEAKNNIVDLDNNHNDPQLCATLACDIYQHLLEAETKKRPSTNFMEEIQKDINPSMRAILIDWLVEVAEEYRLVPDTLYLTVNYIDRYLSGNVMNKQRLQLLGVACMLIAAKYEEICAPQVEEFCYITDNTYFKDEVLQMEAAVLKYLKFEMTAPTAKCFLRRFARAAQGSSELPPLQLEFLANYIAELSLLEYTFLSYSPSLIAASAIFLAKFILIPSKRPWNATIRHYTLYKPSQLCACVKGLHHLFCNSHSSSLPAVREKYSQHKYKFVAKKFCPATIPSQFFQDLRE